MCKDPPLLLLELTLEKQSNQHQNTDCPSGQGGGQCRGYQAQRPGQNQRSARNMNHHFCSEAKDESGAPTPLHALDYDQFLCYVVRGQKQEVNTGGKLKMPDH